MLPEIYADTKAFQTRLKTLQKDFFCVDLHVHSSQSDGLHSIRRLADRCEELSIVIAVTDHNLVPDISNLPESQQKFIIPAIELTSSEAVDILCYFYDWESLKKFDKDVVQPNREKPYKLSLSAEEILCVLSRYRCVVTIPHPVFPLDRIRSNFCRQHTEDRLSAEALQTIHCIEVFNCSRDSRNIPENILKLAKLLKKHMVSGSDAHTAGAVGNSITYCKAKSRSEFLDKLAVGDVGSMAISSRFRDKTLPKVKMAWLHLKGLPGTG